MSCCCHAIHNIPYLDAQIKELYSYIRRLTRQLIVHVVVESTQDYMSIHETANTNVLALRNS
jgi:hypothetical protein